MTRRLLAAATATALGGALTLGLTACAVGVDAAPEVAAAPIAEVTQRAEQASAEAGDAPLTAVEAGELYLALVEPTNALLDDFDAAIAVSDMEGLREVAGRLAVGYEDFAVGLAAAAWPQEVAPAVEALALELEAEIPAWQAIADATTDQETADRLAELPEPGTAAVTIRSVLGLETAPAA